MTATERRTLLKADLQLTTNANNDLLDFLLIQAKENMEIEGITDDGSSAYEGCLKDYAAYLFRKRAADSSGGKEGATAMPRFLRWELNNLLFKQKST